ncbi:hypothetical protein PG994_012899 [Apiospora phragmitis]|uniref:Uncharacterized protein n=1 Tax=Apiospora phragmitis TaxID=2905665 RepID=A0ABR1T738_9PEZI
MEKQDETIKAIARMKLPRDSKGKVPESTTPNSGTKRRVDASEKTTGTVQPPKRSRNERESFVRSFDRFGPSPWQSTVIETGERHRQQVPSDPSTLSTLQTMYELLDGLVERGKIQRGNDLEIDENGWPKLCENNPASDQQNDTRVERKPTTS